MRQPNNGGGRQLPPSFKQIERVHFLAKGPSWYGCPHDVPDNEEIWGLNSVYMDRPDIDRLFIMHDIRDTMLLEDYQLFDKLNEFGIPVITNGSYETLLENNVAYPVMEVVNEFGVNYVLNSICWMIALATYIGVEEIFMYGVDYVHGVDINEKACTEFWMGMAMGRGVEIYIPEESALLKPPELKQTLYGYHVPRAAPEGLLTVEAKRRYGEEHKAYQLTPVEEK